jgi:hypothetical protein
MTKIPGPPITPGAPTTLGGSSAESLLGREAELALVRAAVRELGDGRGSVLAIEGRPGSARPA